MDLLDTDLKHCDLYTAEKVIKEYDTTIQQYLNAHMDICEDYEKVSSEDGYSLAEYLWYGHWDDIVCELIRSSTKH